MYTSHLRSMMNPDPNHTKIMINQLNHPTPQDEDSVHCPPSSHEARQLPRVNARQLTSSPVTQGTCPTARQLPHTRAR